VQKMNQTWQCTQHTTKMLASTIQISNNNPTPRNHATTRQRPSRPGSWNRSPRRQNRLILQNPNSVPPPPKGQGSR
jgi:hypothetical protein